jgi:hypothetical protein
MTTFEFKLKKWTNQTSPHRSEIESFEEMIARFDEETPVQRWFGDASFSGFGFDYGGMAGASSSHPPPVDSPPPVNP